ncbi:MAG: aldehyde ferredoxin oxidoreductase [Spirochaetes bacterium]|nr:aldehyde ferredoxin oxidoreductase [Spirochaetota bacterium]
MHGWTGKILHIDAGSGATYISRPDKSVYERFIGGRGLAGFFLRERAAGPWDSPDMPVIFMTGPLVDTPSPTSGRMCIMSRSPLTGAVCDTSVGGFLGAGIKRAGWDGLIVTGKSSFLCGIEIDDDRVRILDAGSLKGALTGDVFKRFPEGSTAAVGPAAENGVLFANIAVDGHFFSGRGGLGLVLAGKNVKYINVRGSGKTAVFDKEELLKAREEIFRLVSASSVLKGEFGLSEFGTGALYDLMHTRRMMPTANFKRTRFENAPEMNAWNYKNRYGQVRSGCGGCHIQCKKKTSDGRPVPEFETMSHFSALIGNTDIETVVEANRLCNEFGMDTITAASTIACFSEIEGFELRPDKILGLIGDMGLSRGDGEILKLGSRLYAGKKGHSASSMSVKGLELPAYDPRGAYGMALSYATSTRGGCHLRAYPVSSEILRKPVATDRFGWSGKARIIKLSEDLNAVVDSLTACKFIFFAASLEEYARALSGVTGSGFDAQDLMKAGERIYYAERIMNASNGFTSDDDDLPPRFFSDGGSGGGGIEVAALSRDDFLTARSNYYRVRGLDEKGMPLREKCEEIGLEWTV